MGLANGWTLACSLLPCPVAIGYRIHVEEAVLPSCRGCTEAYAQSSRGNAAAFTPPHQRRATPGRRPHCLLSSQRYDRVDTRRTSGGDEAGSQRGEKECDHRRGKRPWICRFNVKQEGSGRCAEIPRAHPAD